MIPRRRTEAPALAPETVAVLVGGWRAVPPTVTEGGCVDPNYLTLYAPDGIRRLWEAYEPWLREQAAAWSWSPMFTIDSGTKRLYYGAAVSRVGDEDSQRIRHVDD